MPGPEWKKTACNICYVNCGDRGSGRRRQDRQGARRPRQSEIAGLSLQQGRADSLLRPSSRPAHHAVAPPRRRRLRRDRLGHRDCGNRRARPRPRRTSRRQESRALWRRRTGQPCRRRLCHRLPARARLASRFQCALAGEDRRLLGQRSVVRQPALPHRRGRRIIATSCCVIGANPWIAHGFPNARDTATTSRTIRRARWS